ncbi:hypothetical protein PPMP20_29405 [Paraburkholderia phymatum]|uniref:hypothetical protein n=1 Tax=Paraburkholderia phymatum TaxID=148447 RepID=UPI00142F1FAC|nr:hypothetical protein [Paraburkholderia phymatum]
MYANPRAGAMTSVLFTGTSFDDSERGTKNEQAAVRSAKQAMLERLSGSRFTAMAQQA